MQEATLRRLAGEENTLLGTLAPPQTEKRRMNPKNIIVPLQKWLLKQRRCVGCGRLLAQGKREKKRGLTLVSCYCGRIFVYKKETSSYRRALFEEVR